MVSLNRFITSNCPKRYKERPIGLLNWNCWIFLEELIGLWKTLFSWTGSLYNYFSLDVLFISILQGTHWMSYFISVILTNILSVLFLDQFDEIFHYPLVKVLTCILVYIPVSSKLESQPKKSMITTMRVFKFVMQNCQTEFKQITSKMGITVCSQKLRCQ